SLTRHLKITLRDSVRSAVCVIGCRYKNIEVFGKAQSPGIVGSIAKELQLPSIGGKMIQSLAKAHSVFTITHHSFKARIANRSPYRVIGSVTKIGRPGMRIKC